MSKKTDKLISRAMSLLAQRGRGGKKRISAADRVRRREWARGLAARVKAAKAAKEAQ